MKLLVQAVVDHHGSFLEYELGWPGSVADTVALKQSELWLNKGILKMMSIYWQTKVKPNCYFDSSLLIFGLGYPLTKFTIRPFADHDLTNDPAEASACHHFNRELSHLHVRVENAFGILKGQFLALCTFTGHNIRQMWMFVESLLILHNILQEFGDDPYDIEGFNGQEEDDPSPPNEAESVLVDGARGRNRISENVLYQTGLVRRKGLLNFFRDV